MPLPAVLAKIVKTCQHLGFINESQVATLMATEEISGDALNKLLLSEYKLKDSQLLLAKAQAFEMYPFNAKAFRAAQDTFDTLDRDFCLEHKILPVGFVGNCFVFITADTFPQRVIELVSQKTRKRGVAMLGQLKDIMPFIEVKKAEDGKVGYGDVMASLSMDVTDEEIASIEEDEEESGPIIQLASRIIEDAQAAGASDIHIDPFEKETRVRFRIDGQLREMLRIPNKAAAALMSRYKVMSNLDIAERRLPQDGRIVFKNYTKKNLDIDLRVSTAPLNHGEGAVMRILDKNKSTLPLPALGYSEENLAKYRELIQSPYGMILHCGPTGSGKSMTLYSALGEVNTPETCIRTAEDPIEYTLQGINQMQMQRKIGLTFAFALRAFLRQDPDIILVGEIRDKETAQIAIEAALTGHLLFSTLHTNDAPSTVSRLTEMDIEPFMISASLVCVCAQRLMRRVCKTCKQPYVPEGREAEIIEKALGWKGQIFKANSKGGCPTCGGTGYKGRVGIHELMSVSEELIKGINSGREAAILKRLAVRNGMKTLHQDSMLKVRDGVSTIEESLSTVPPDLEDLNAILAATSYEEVTSDAMMSQVKHHH